MNKEMLGIISMSSWSFAITLTTVFFGYIGLCLDRILHINQPFFMTGFVILSIILCMLRLYKEAKSRM